MSGVSLPAIRGALPSFHKRSYTGLDSRPDSRNSSVASTNIANYTLNNGSYGKIFQFDLKRLSFSFKERFVLSVNNEYICAILLFCYPFIHFSFSIPKVLRNLDFISNVSFTSKNDYIN